jgi:hypothetical protein
VLAAARITDTQLEEIQRALSGVPTSLTTSRLAEQLKADVPDVSHLVDDLLEALTSLALLADGGPPVERVAQDVSGSADLELDEGERDVLAARLDLLLRIPAIRLSAHAYDLVTEYERIYHEARILTDIRPVFDPADAEVAAPKAAVVMASLKIEHHASGTGVSSDFYAMDRTDLLQLRETVDRALKKVERIQLMLAESGVGYWEYRDGSAA